MLPPSLLLLYAIIPAWFIDTWHCLVTNQCILRFNFNLKLRRDLEMSEERLFAVNFDGPISVYVQVENQIQFGIASGRIKSGDTLPSIPIMMDMLNVNQNTITKAYRDLEIRGIVRTRRGVGVTVTEEAPKLCKDSIINKVKAHLIEAVAECASCGFSASEIQAHVSEAIKSGCQPYETD